MQIYIDGCGNYFKTLEEFEKWAEKKMNLRLFLEIQKHILICMST